MASISKEIALRMSGVLQQSLVDNRSICKWIISLIRGIKRGFFEKIINNFVESIGQFGIPGFKFREPF